MNSSLTYGEGIDMLQEAFCHCIKRIGKPRGDPSEMSLKEMLLAVDVVDEADIVAIGTLIGVMAKLAVWKQAMMGVGVEFIRPQKGPANRIISFKYWHCPDNMRELVPPEKLNTLIIATVLLPAGIETSSATVPAALPRSRV